MPTIHVDYLQCAEMELSTAGTDDQTVDGDGYVLPVFIPDDQVAAWLAAYDSSNQYSPSAADSRTIARAVLDALKKKVEEG